MKLQLIFVKCMSVIALLGVQLAIAKEDAVSSLLESTSDGEKKSIKKASTVGEGTLRNSIDMGKGRPRRIIGDHQSPRPDKSMSLAERWTLIIQDEKDDPINTAFTNLLKVEESKESNNTESPIGAKSKPPKTFFSVGMSIALSTLTIVAMASATTLSSTVYDFPYKMLEMEWKQLPEILPSLLSARYQLLQKLETYFTNTFIPVGLQTMEKMILMEVWRTFWSETFRCLRGYYLDIFQHNYYNTMWEQYAPGWVRRGVRSFFVKIVQGRLQNFIYSWMTRGWEVVSIGFGVSWLDFEPVADADPDAPLSESDSCEEVAMEPLQDLSGTLQAEVNGISYVEDHIPVDANIDIEDELSIVDSDISVEF